MTWQQHAFQGVLYEHDEPCYPEAPDDQQQVQYESRYDPVSNENEHLWSRTVSPAGDNASHFMTDMDRMSNDSYYGQGYQSFDTPYTPTHESLGQSLFAVGAQRPSPDSVSNPTDADETPLKSKVNVRKRGRYPCLAPRCEYYGTRSADLQRHLDFVHNRDTATLLDCEHLDCPRRGKNGFTRRDKVLEHMRDVHQSTKYPKRIQKSGTQRYEDHSDATLRR